jgi:hypothetical protein
MPGSFAEAVERIAGCYNAIGKAIDAGHAHDAHRPLDEADIILNRLPEIARDSGVPKRHWEKVVVAGEEIRDLLNEIHGALDDGRPAEFQSVAPRIAAALDSLEEVFEKSSKPQSANEVRNANP